MNRATIGRVFKSAISWVRLVLLEHVKLVGVGVLILGLAVAVTLCVQVLVLPPTVTQDTPSATPTRRLSFEIIDQLELWIEEVDAEQKAGFPLPNRSLFVVEDVVVKE